MSEVEVWNGDFSRILQIYSRIRGLHFFIYDWNIDDALLVT